MTSLRKKDAKKINFSKKVKDRIYKSYTKVKDLIFRPEIEVKGKEPSKSYSFDKKFFPLYTLFLLYSFVLIWGINSPNNIVIRYLTFGNTFAFSLSIVFLILSLSILYSNNKMRVFMFEKYTYIKQPILYISVVALYYFLLDNVFPHINYVNFLLGLSLIWIVLLSSRYYIYSRKFATKIEARFISKYSIIRYGIALIVPLFILAILTTVGVAYRTLLVFISLIFFAPLAPIQAVQLYNLEMRLIMPAIYFSLVMTFVFIIFEFVSTRRRAKTKRVGTFDNFTFSLIVFFIFFFQIFQISIYLLLRPEFIDAIKATVGTGSATVSYVFLFEFIFSSIILYRIILKLGRSYGWRVLFFKKDGLILFFLGCVLAQTLSRYSLANQVSNQDITIVGQFLLSDKFLISIIMIVFLGITLLIYYIKPHETSMFMRLQKETVNEEEKSMDIIHKLMQSEFIRRGESYPLEILEREMIKSTKLSKSVIYSLIHRLAKKEFEIELIEKKDDFGRKTYWVDFVSVFDQYEKRGRAEKKVKKYMSEKLVKSTSSRKKKRLVIEGKLDSNKASDRLLASLASGFEKKYHDQTSGEKNIGSIQEFSLKHDELPENLKNQIIDIIKEEYKYRVENVDEYPEITFPISQISAKIQLNTKISVGELYPILENINDPDIYLAENTDEPEDKKIDVIPFADDELNYLLLNFRPNEYKRVQLLAMKNFQDKLKKRNYRLIISNLGKNMSKENEVQKFWSNLLSYMYDNYKDFRKYFERPKDYSKIKEIIKLVAKGKI